MKNRDRDEVPAPDDINRESSGIDADPGENTARTERIHNEPGRRQAGFLGDGRSDVGRTGSKNNSDH